MAQLERSGSSVGESAMTPSRTLSASADTLINLVEQESVLLELKSEQYFGLNESGTRMWAALMEARTVEGAYQKLIAEYDVEPEQLRKDLDELVDKLIG